MPTRSVTDNLADTRPVAALEGETGSTLALENGQVTRIHASPSSILLQKPHFFTRLEQIKVVFCSFTKQPSGYFFFVAAIVIAIVDGDLAESYYPEPASFQRPFLCCFYAVSPIAATSYQCTNALLLLLLLTLRQLRDSLYT